MFVFRKVWRALLSCYLRFEIHPFALLPTISLNLICINILPDKRQDDNDSNY